MTKKSPYLFFYNYLESMYYRYLPCLILSHDYDEKCDFLNYEQLTIACHYSIQEWSSSKERVGSREDVTSSDQTTQQLDGIIFSKASIDKKHMTKDKT